MTEAEFISSIDCRFPYNDRRKASELIGASLRISTNAVFTVVHELARSGRGASVSFAVLLELLSELENQFEHPLKTLVFAISRRMILGEKLSEHEVLQAISQVVQFPGEYQALNVIYFSGEPHESVEFAYEAVCHRWQKASKE